MKGRVLIIAGSDSGGGAGIQADIKSVTAMAAFAMTAITALTAQNTHGVQRVRPIPPAFIRAQINSIMIDLGADAIKTGMLGDVETIALVADEISKRANGIPIVVDPVMVAKGGHALLAPDAVAHLARHLIPLATLLTPNLPEAEALTGRSIRTEAQMRDAASALLDLGAQSILLKGGHLPGDELIDLLVSGATTMAFRSARIHTRHTHGTGCTLASAIAAGLAQGLPLAPSIARAREYVRAAIATAPEFGGGHGPINHAVTVDVSRLS